MNARSEGDETPLWLDAHACQEAPSGGINASGLEVSRERNFQRARRARRHSCALCRGGRSERVRRTRECVRRTHEYLHSHSEWIVGRSSAFMNNPG